MNKVEWIVISALSGSGIFVAGAALVNVVMQKIVPNLVQWNKAPAIPAAVFYGFVAFGGLLSGAGFGYLMSKTPPEQRLQSAKVLLFLIPLCLATQRLFDAIVNKRNAESLKQFHHL